MFKIKDPLDNCVVRLGRMSSFTHGGLIKPHAQTYKNMFARVLQVGSAFHPKDYLGREVAVGDFVLFRDWGALTAIPDVGKNLHLVKFPDLVGWIIVKEDETVSGGLV